MLKQFNANTTIDYTIKVAKVIENIVRMLYEKWYMEVDPPAFILNPSDKITKHDIISYIKKNKVLSKYYKIPAKGEPWIPDKNILIFDKSLNDINIDVDAMVVINHLIYGMVKAFALHMNAGKGLDPFKHIVKKILTSKYKDFV